jgi:hypothetical protein
MYKHTFKNGNTFQFDIDNVDAINLMNFKRFFYKCCSNAINDSSLVFTLLSREDTIPEIIKFCEGIGTFNGLPITKKTTETKEFVIGIEKIIEIIIQEYGKLQMDSTNEDTKKKNASSLT